MMIASECKLPTVFRLEDPNFNELRGLYDLYRDYMKHEDDLINQRSTWHLLIQGFLFGALGVLGEWPAASSGLDRLYLERWFLVYVFAGAGSLIAFFAFVSVRAANNAIDSLCAKWKCVLDTYEQNTKAYLPAIAGGGHSNAQLHGKRPAMWIPLIILFAWLSVIAMSAADRVYPHPIDGPKAAQAILPH